MKDTKLFKLREEHVRYLLKLMQQREAHFYELYGDDYKETLRDNNNSSISNDKIERELVSYITQRCKLLIAEYDAIKHEKEIKVF